MTAPLTCQTLLLTARSIQNSNDDIPQSISYKNQGPKTVFLPTERNLSSIRIGIHGVLGYKTTNISIFCAELLRLFRLSVSSLAMPGLDDALAPNRGGEADHQRPSKVVIHFERWDLNHCKHRLFMGYPGIPMTMEPPICYQYMLHKRVLHSHT